jgi:hypothetical protein
MGVFATIGSLVGNFARQFVNREVRFALPCHHLLDSTCTLQFALLSTFQLIFHATGHSFWTFLVDLGRMRASISRLAL